MSRSIVLGIGAIVALGFAAAAFLNQQFSAEWESVPAPADINTLVRSHSPVVGPADAPVTIVEFFDPSCGACRAFHPIIKQMIAKHPGDVRLVVRYVLFHKGSEEAARIIEAAHGQGLFEAVLEAVLDAQADWHGDPKAQKAWEAAATAGLDVEKARESIASSEVDAVLGKDMDDVKAIGVSRTPTFYVNGKPLTKFGVEPLQALVQSEIDQVAR